MTARQVLMSHVLIYGRMLLLMLLGRPYKLTLLASSGCNLRCRICSLWKHENTSLGLGEVARIWAALPSKPCWVNISGGEPTLNPELEAILTFFVETGRALLLTLTTNGMVDSAPIVSRVLERNKRSLVYVSVSMDGYERDHDAIRGRAGAFARVQNTYGNLRSLQSLRKELKLGMSVTLSRFNYRRVLPFVQHVSRGCSAVTFNLAQSSPYYENSQTESFDRLPTAELVPVLKALQVSLPRLSLDTLIKVNYLEMVVRRLRGQYRPIPCTSLTNNVLVSSHLDLLDCTMSFRPWPVSGGERTDKLGAIVDVLRRPKPRARALRQQLAVSRCEYACHTPCEKYLHIISALLTPWHAPRLLATYLRICLLSVAKRQRIIESAEAVGQLGDHAHTVTDGVLDATPSPVLSMEEATAVAGHSGYAARARC